MTTIMAEAENGVLPAKGRVLSVTSECVPLIKTGGLADVAGALPAALRAEGWDMRVLMPAYPGLKERFAALEPVWGEPDVMGGPAQVLAGRLEGIDFLMFDAPHLFDRAGSPYLGPDGLDHPDNAERFAALSWAAAAIARDGLSTGWKPDVIHAHDWQGGLAPVYARLQGLSVGTVVTIHNIAFQGLAPAEKMGALRLSWDAFHSGMFEYWGQISALKGGITAADRVTTVSPTYARELMRPEVGMGLQGVIADRGAAMTGILNGIDEIAWNPEADPGVLPYSTRQMKGKAANRDRLRADFGLGEVPGPLAVVVSRMSWQKGLDLLPQVLDGFVARGGGLAVLGAGDAEISAGLAAVAARHPGRVAVRTGYDEALPHRMFAGGDAVLVPSRFEPCGLTQMYGLRYGAVPVVSAVGGLADTVIDANKAALDAGCATGVVFTQVDRLGLAQALDRLVDLYAQPGVFRAIQRAGMKQDMGWRRSAAAYARLYEDIRA
ncbi:glycogen synthase GlgA [Frigidibacter sp. MR17.14]|uniref:glycogen synthase GlgA n=1 Tax=Frigidibacter sp. MR17.14 TaxID=3126509 RepID=UPI003012B94D